jgi:parallel beta-helix repeat protein
MASLQCGQEITEDTTLDADLSCTSGPALIIAADNVTLDLGDHTVSGTADSGSDTPGLVFRNVKGSTVRNGTVQHFAAGVAINGGSGNVVQNVTLEDNIGGANFGDGIVVDGSKENRIIGNTIRRNGPFSGISLLNQSTHNEIRHNIVTDNNMSHTGVPSDGRQDMGIRLEGPGASHNKIDSNAVTGSGSDGITVLPTCTDFQSDPPKCEGAEPNEHNRIANNTCNSNGVSGRGDGIKVFCMPTPVPPVHNAVVDNFTYNNTTNGISFEARTNKNEALRNSGQGNGQFDGFDGNDAAGTNTWTDNDFGTANPPYVGGDKHVPRGTHTDRPALPGQAAPGSGEVSQETIEGLMRKNLAAAETGSRK